MQCTEHTTTTIGHAVPIATEAGTEAIHREVEAVLRDRLWIHPDQVGVRVDRGTATLTGTVGRRSTADIATRLTAAVPRVTKVINRIRYEFDDAELVRSRIDRTHPFSAEPFHPGP
jgi:osmotically-inducible protein OsmY